MTITPQAKRFYSLSKFDDFLTRAERENESREGRLVVIDRLQPALDRQRALGADGHWAYCLTTHLNLIDILYYERAVLQLEDT